MESTHSQSRVEQLAKMRKKRSLKIFIVEDDEYFNTMLNSYIEQISKELEFKAKTWSYLNGDDCLMNIQIKPDFVILDFYLDENKDSLTGGDVLEKICTYHKDIKVIVISQRHEWENFKDEFKNFGALGFLKKDEALYQNLKEMIKNNDENEI